MPRHGSRSRRTISVAATCTTKYSRASRSGSDRHRCMAASSYGGTFCVFRLCARGHPALGADGAAGDLRAHPRFNQARRRRQSDAPINRALAMLRALASMSSVPLTSHRDGRMLRAGSTRATSRQRVLVLSLAEPPRCCDHGPRPSRQSLRAGFMCCASTTASPRDLTLLATGSGNRDRRNLTADANSLGQLYGIAARGEISMPSLGAVPGLARRCPRPCAQFRLPYRHRGGPSRPARLGPLDQRGRGIFIGMTGFSASCGCFATSTGISASRQPGAVTAALCACSGCEEPWPR